MEEIKIGETCLGRHLLVDLENVPANLCLDDKLIMNILVDSILKAGPTILNTLRYFFDKDPKGYSVVVMLDESHCSIHTVVDGLSGKMVIDMFTCGKSDPNVIYDSFKSALNLPQNVVETKEYIPRFKI